MIYRAAKFKSSGETRFLGVKRRTDIEILAIVHNTSKEDNPSSTISLRRNIFRIYTLSISIGIEGLKRWCKYATYPIAQLVSFPWPIGRQLWGM